MRTRLTTRLKINRVTLRGRRWSRIDLLEQDRWWVDTHGKIHDVRKIDVEYRANLIAYLERSARRIRFMHEWTTRGPYGDDDPYDDSDDLEWMRGRPLYRAIKNG